jgi:hypothetical protein
MLPVFHSAHQSLLTAFHLSIPELFLIESAVIETLTPCSLIHFFLNPRSLRSEAVLAKGSSYRNLVHT